MNGSKGVNFYKTTLGLEPVLNQFSTVTFCRFPPCVFYTRVYQVTSYILAKEVKVPDSSETLVPIYNSKGFVYEAIEPLSCTLSNVWYIFDCLL